MGDHFFGITDCGRLRDNNEDTFVAQELAGTKCVVAAVIDGVGGYEGGEVAAAIAQECISSQLSTLPPDIPAAMRSVLVDANHRIIEEKQKHPGHEKMACVLTVAFADIDHNQFYYAHVGDTRLYLLRGESLVKVTKDHSFVGFLEDSNRLTEAEAMQHPRRNEINKALGFDPSIALQLDYMEMGSSPFLPGDILLLCSDGLTDMIGRQEITDILTSADTIQKKAKALIDAANNAGGRDNVTAVLVQNPRERQALQPTMPAERKAEQTANKNVAQSRQTSSHVVRRGVHPGIVWGLVLVCAGLLAALLWQMNRPKAVQPVALPSPTPPPPPRRVRNAAEQQLIDSLNKTMGTLALDSTVFKSPVMITDSLVINRDSLHFSGNGIVLRGDSTLDGPAMILATTARYVFLENIVFENFPVAILANSNALRLKNVRFVHCDVPVSYQFRFADGMYAWGTIHKGLFFKTDSLPDNRKAWQ